MLKNKRLIILIGFLIISIVFSYSLNVYTAVEKPVKGNLEIWAFEDDAGAINLLKKKFVDRFPGISLTIRRLKWSGGYDVINTAAKNNRLPDVLQLGTTWISIFSKKGYLQPLDDFCYTSPVTRPFNFYLSSKRSYTSIQERLIYSVPFNLDTRLLVYNKKLLNYLGFDTVPRTWADVRKIHNLMKKKSGSDRVTLSMPENDTIMFLIFIWQNNSDLYDWKNDHLNMNDTSVAVALAEYKSLFASGAAVDYDLAVKPQTDLDILDAFKQEKVAMFIAGPWILKALKNGKLSDYVPETGIALIPALKNHYSFMGGSHWVIPRKSKNTMAAWKFIEFMTEPDNQIFCYHATGMLPSIRTAWNHNDLINKENVQIFKKQLELTNAPPGIRNWEDISSKIILSLKEASTDINKNIEILNRLNKEISRRILYVNTDI